MRIPFPSDKNPFLFPCTRREFLKRAGKAGAAATMAGSFLLGCSRMGSHKGRADALTGVNRYADLTKNWDPIYGPPIQPFSRYGGRGDFQGHSQGEATPGVDYDVVTGTPLVPLTTSYARRISRDTKGVLYILFVDALNPTYQIVLGHLEDVLIDEKYLLVGDIMKYLGQQVRALGRQEIVALSGSSGFGPKEYGWVQPPHLHLSLLHWNNEKRTLEDLDPEKHGFDGGRPVFFDGRAFLDVKAAKRLSWLENTLIEMEREVGQWPEGTEMKELEGSLMEHARLLGDERGGGILRSRHFQDLRALLKRVTLEEKRYLPGTGPYHLMLKVLGYSTDERQKIVLTLPFISPGLEKHYRKPDYSQGSFFPIGTVQE